MKYVVLLLSLAFLQGCQKDLGNYNYQTLDDLLIDGVDSLYVVNDGEALRIKPNLSTQMESKIDPNNLSFEWFLGIESGMQGIAPRLFSTSRDLDTILNLPLGEIEMYLRVTDKTTGIFALKTFKLAMTNQGYEGWLVLNDVAGKARIDMINIYKNNNRVYTDIIQEMQGNFLLTGKPLSIITARTNDVYEGFLTYVLTDKGGFAINYDSFNQEPTFDFSQTLIHSSFTDFTESRLEAAAPMFEVLSSHGSVFIKPNAYEFRPAINHSNDQLFRASPFVASADKYYQCILFNEDDNSFYRYPGTGINCFPIILPELDSREKKLLYMSYTKYNGGEVFAVLQDQANQKVYLVRMLLSGQLLTLDEISGPEIASAEHFAISPAFGYLFYSKAGRLYEFDFAIKKTTKMLDLADQQISMLKFPITHLYRLKEQYMQMQYDLVLATYNTEKARGSGELSIYSVPSTNRPLERKSNFKGFDQIIDVAYKERF